MMMRRIRTLLCLVAGLVLGHGAQATIITQSGPPLDDIDIAAPGVSQFLAITDAGIINDLNLSVEISGTWTPENDITLIHVDTGTSAAVYQSAGTGQGSFNVTFDDEATAGCAHQTGLNGSCIPDNLLSIFDGENIQGDWEIHFEDNQGIPDDGDDLLAWSITADIIPTSVPLPAPLLLIAPALAAMLLKRKQRLART